MCIVAVAVVDSKTPLSNRVQRHKMFTLTTSILIYALLMLNRTSSYPRRLEVDMSCYVPSDFEACYVNNNSKFISTAEQKCQSLGKLIFTCMYATQGYGRSVHVECACPSNRRSRFPCLGLRAQLPTKMKPISQDPYGTQIGRAHV